MYLNEPPYFPSNHPDNFQHTKQEGRSRLMDGNLKDHLSTISEEKTEILQRPLSAKPYVGGRRDLGSPRSERKSKKSRFVNEFQTVLAKINANQTRELGMREAQKLILSNQTPQGLRICLSGLSDHHQKQTLNSGSREMVVLLLGYIVSIYKTNLLDPIDNPPDLIKTVVRISETVHGHFKDETPSVQQACARTLNELYTGCLSNCDIQTVSLVMVEPLLSILNGGADRISQHTAAVCLCEFLYLLVKKGAKDLLIFVSDKIYQLYLKTSHEFVELIRSIGICLSIAKLKNLPEKVFHLINRLSSSIRRNIPQASVAYQVKIECCNVIAIIARIFKRNKASIPGDLSLIYNRVADMLRDLSKNKIYKVQQAGTEALKIWEDLNRSEEIPDVMLKGVEDEEDISIEVLHNIFTVGAGNPQSNYEELIKENGPKSYKSIRDQLKKAKKQEQSKNNKDVQVTGSKDLKALIDKNINDYLQDAVVGSNKTQDFVKARSGNGGGFAGWSAENQIEKKPSYEMQKRHLKDLILGKKSLLQESGPISESVPTRESQRGELSGQKSGVKKLEAGTGNVLLGKIEISARKSRKRYIDPDEKEPNYFEGIKISTQYNGITAVGLTPQRDIQKVEVPLKRTKQIIQALHKPQRSSQSGSPVKRSQLPVYEQYPAEENDHENYYYKPAMRYADDIFAESQTFGMESHYDMPPKNKIRMYQDAHQAPLEQDNRDERPTNFADRDSRAPVQKGRSVVKTEIARKYQHEENNSDDESVDQNFVAPGSTQQKILVREPRLISDGVKNPRNENQNSDDESVDNNLVEAAQTQPNTFVREPQFKQFGWYPSLEQNQSEILQFNSTAEQPVNLHSMNYKMDKNEDEVKATKQTDSKGVGAEKSNYSTRRLMEMSRQMRPQSATVESTQSRLAYKNEDQIFHNQINTQPVKKAEINPPQSYTTENIPNLPSGYLGDSAKKLPKLGVRFADNVNYDQPPHIRLDEFPKEQQDYFLPVVNKFHAHTAKHESSRPKENFEKTYPSTLDERPIRPMSQEQYQQIMQPVHENAISHTHTHEPLHDTWDEELFERNRNRQTEHNTSKLEDTMLWETMTSTEIRQRFSDIPVYEGSQTQTTNQTNQEPKKREIKPPQVQPVFERKIERKTERKMPSTIVKPPATRTKLLPQEDVSTLDIWHQALEKIGQGDIETAYRNILATGDDVYLVRLLNVTGPCLKKLQPQTTVKLIKQLTKIMKSGFIEKLAVSFLENSGKNGIPYALQPNDQQTLFSTLYKLSSSSNAVGKKSAQLYTELRNK